MSFDKAWKKTEGRDGLDKWSIQKFNIEPFDSLKNKLGEIQKAYFVEYDSENKPLRNPKI